MRPLLAVVHAVLAIASCRAISFADEARNSTDAVNPLERTIVKEPKYRATPKYCLLSLGNRSEVKVWMVEDGERLFVDRNANGDLTDDGPPIEPSKVRELSARRRDFEYSLDAITPTNGKRQTDFVLKRWNYGEKEDSYGLSISVDGQMPMYAGWFGTFWSTQRDQAPVIHLGGPFTPQLLRRNAFTIGEKGKRLSLCFVHPGSVPGADSRLSIDALARVVVPELSIAWPMPEGAAPLRTSHPLTSRCCYWEFYTTDFEVPKGVVAGMAKISVGFVTGATPIELTRTEMKAPVVAAPSVPEAAR